VKAYGLISISKSTPVVKTGFQPGLRSVQGIAGHFTGNIWESTISFGYLTLFLAAYATTKLREVSDVKVCGVVNGYGAIYKDEGVRDYRVVGH
jgi:hypothetical protein